ncbi:MAG: hypothetical protein WCG97_03290 [bacterium]
MKKHLKTVIFPLCIIILAILAFVGGYYLLYAPKIEPKHLPCAEGDAYDIMTGEHCIGQ